MAFLGAVLGGICSVIGSIGSCIGGFIGGGLSAITGAIGGFASSIGSALASGASALASGISSIGAKLLGGIGSIGNIVSGIGKVLGLFAPEDDEEPEDLGYRACQSEKKPEDFDSTEKYINHLKTEVEYDREKAKVEMEKDPVKKYAYAAVGTTITGNGISEKVGLNIGTKGLVTLGLMHRAAPYLTAKNFTDFLSHLKTNGYADLATVYSYFTGKGDIDFVKTGADIKSGMSGMNLEGRTTNDFVADVKDEFRKTEEERFKEDNIKNK